MRTSNGWTPGEWQAWVEHLDEVERAAVAALAAAGIRFTVLPDEPPVLGATAVQCPGCNRVIPLVTLATHRGLCASCREKNGDPHA